MAHIFKRLKDKMKPENVEKAKAKSSEMLAEINTRARHESLKIEMPNSILIKRQPYEEPYCLNLVLLANNGIFGGRIEYYCNADDLKVIGTRLQSFPKTFPDKYSYELGSGNPEVNFAYHFAMHAYTIDKCGHCALQIVIDNREKKPRDGKCQFSIKAEPEAIKRLGKLISAFSQLRHYALFWSPTGEHDRLIDREEDLLLN